MLCVLGPARCDNPSRIPWNATNFAIAARPDDEHVYSGSFMQSNANKYATMQMSDICTTFTAAV